MPHSFHRNRQSELLVRRTPRSAADAPVGLYAYREYVKELA